MKMKKLTMYFLLVFMSTFIFTSFAKSTEATYYTYKFCTFPLSIYSQVCSNPSSGNDGLAKWTNRMDDSVLVNSAYSMKFNTTKWTPTVTYGEPIYQSYLLTDNKNGTYYRIDSNYGKKLNGIAYTQIGLGQTVSFYPAAGQKPTTNLTIKSADPYSCAAKIAYCNTYTQASEFTIQP